MAMFPCITGIPTKLNSDMQAVLNKKMGTSGQTYPIQTWSDEVNLLGKLPEKTASGAIANFADGADDVPVKEAKFYFLPKQASGTPTPSSPLAIDGWTGLTGYQFGKNMIDLSSMVDGYVNANGTFNTNHSNGEMRSGFISVKPNTTYYFSIVETTGQAADWVGIGEYTSNDVTSFIRRDSFWRFTTSENAKYIVVSSRNLAQATKIQLEVGNDPTTYEAYQTPTSYPINWQDSADTLYGGYVDAVRGKVVKTHGSVDLGTLDWTITQTLQEERAFYTDDLSSVIDPPSSNNIAIDGYCENLPVNSQNNVMNTSASGICSNTSGRVFIFNYSYNSMTKEQFTSAVNGKLFVYPLATPEEYDITAFTPSTYLGSNNFYSDANGDTEITYRADIDLVIQALQGNRGLMVSSMRTNSESEEMSDNSDNTEEQEEER